MSLEEQNFNTENAEPRQQSPQEILEHLRELQSKYSETELYEERGVIEQNQHKLIQQLKMAANKILEHAEDPSISEVDRDELMGLYGSIIDQLAINIPWPELRMGGERALQDQALKILQAYLETHAYAEEVARSLFMLFHHGAGIDAHLTAEAYLRMSEEQPPSAEFSRQYVNAERKGRVFLEKYIGLVLGKKQFSFDTDYQELSRLEHISDKQFAYILDAANWYRRIAYYQKHANLHEDQEKNTQRAIELHEKLVKVDPTFSQYLDAIYHEQGIENPNE